VVLIAPDDLVTEPVVTQSMYPATASQANIAKVGARGARYCTTERFQNAEPFHIRIRAQGLAIGTVNTSKLSIAIVGQQSVRSGVVG
jgi:hypothetical protein